MTTMYKSCLDIGGKTKTVIVINHDAKKKAVESKNVDCLHHIHILDRSGSMSGSIGKLIENVKQTIEFIPENDYVSIIWFSGAGQYKTLIKGAKKDVGLYKLLDGIKNTIGCTCFSESLEEVGVIINDLKGICSNFNVTLFTDGQPVTPWSIPEEESRMFKAIGKWKNDVIALNTVGYGNYYNQDLLKKVAAESQFGQLVHSSKIDEYMSIFSHNYERVSDLCVENIKINALLFDILYIASKSTKFAEDEMVLSMLDKKKNQFVLITEFQNGAFFTYNDAVYLIDDIKTAIPAASIEPILYAYAYEQYYKGNRQCALDILAKTLKDKRFVDKQTTAFTFDEVGAYSKSLQKAIFSKKDRFVAGKCPDNYIPADDAFCVMDVLKLLVEKGAEYVYSNSYNRIGLATTDNFNLFKRVKGLPVTPMDELVFNEKQLNISVRSKIQGVVTLNPIRASQVGLPGEIKSQIFRNQTIVKDGNLNMEEITIVAKPEVCKELADKGIVTVIEAVTDNDGNIVKDQNIIAISLENLPIINRMYINSANNTKGVLDRVLDLTRYEARQKVLNYVVKGINATTVTGKFTEYTPEQVAVLQEHGLDKSLNYVGVDMQKAEKSEDDYYEARTIEFSIKGMASLPSVPEVLKKMADGSKLNSVAAMMAELIEHLKDFYGVNLDDMCQNVVLLPALNDMLKHTKERITANRIVLCSIKMAKVLTGDWFADTIPDGKGGYAYTDDGDTLVIKTGKIKCYF